MSRNYCVEVYIPGRDKTSDFDQNRIVTANRRGLTHDYGITAVQYRLYRYTWTR